MTMNQIAVSTVKVVIETPSHAQGETEARPSAEPKASKINETDAATTAPQKIAAHETADWEDSADGAEAAATAILGSVTRFMSTPPLCTS